MGETISLAIFIFGFNKKITYSLPQSYKTTSGDSLSQVYLILSCTIAGALERSLLTS